MCHCRMQFWRFDGCFVRNRLGRIGGMEKIKDGFWAEGPCLKFNDHVMIFGGVGRCKF